MEVKMPTIFYTGKLPWQMKPVMYLNNLVTWMLGNIKDTGVMKERVERAYDGAMTDGVFRYDDLAMEQYTKIARELVEDTDVRDKEVLDVGCGTGILSLMLMERGARKVVCGDLSAQMLDQCRKKAGDKGYGADRMEFRKLDSESLPFEDSSFDVVASSMVLELIPDQQKALEEMVRVVRPGGTVAVSTHGPEHYYELIDASLRATSFTEFLHFLGYRFEIWHLDEVALAQILKQAGLVDTQTRRLTWREVFKDGSEAYDVFVGTSSAYWYEKIPPNKRAEMSDRARRYFVRNDVKSCGMDVTFGYGRKSG
jgi:ubiquinone/menaquinone biosynthesis C-methylase UbiE